MSSSHNEMIESQLLKERKTRHVQTCNERWLSVKSEAFKLYMQRDMQLEEVMARIEISHGFTASLRSWKLKLKEWRYKKNMSPNTMRWVVSKDGKRDHETKDTDFFFNGIEIKKERIENFKRRKIGEEPISADSEEMGDYYADSLRCVLSSISISRDDAGHGSKDSSDVKTQRNDTSTLRLDEVPVISMVARYLQNDPNEPDSWSTENYSFSYIKNLNDINMILAPVSPSASSSIFAVVNALDSASAIDEDVFCDKLYLGNLVKYEDCVIQTLEQEFKLSKIDKEGGRRCLEIVDEEGPKVIAQDFLSTVYLNTSRPRTATSSFFLALTDFIVDFDSTTSESNDIRLGIIQDIFTMFASCNSSKWARLSSCMRQMTDTIIEAVADGDTKKSLKRLFIHGFSFARELSVFVDVVEIAEEMYESLLKHSSTINVDLYGIELAKAYREYGNLLKGRDLWSDYCEQLLLACDFAL
ncbi:hypothetical protein HYALB_00010426 [Hymenoscyphus albidus]|uniref:Clr5 domain-containing protein n=1 Tax=Hymenoscyphus albidus TaxID=595503 RepID=A0A9N9PV51_9HELO|nr:hypothetical protein HYALB_00010426 [Hymenoscyphus albidus]